MQNNTYGDVEEVIFESSRFCPWQLRQVEFSLSGNAAIVTHKIKALFLRDELIIIITHFNKRSFSQNKKKTCLEQQLC